MADPRLLVVEGADDQHVIWALLERHKFEPHFTVHDERGYDKLFKGLRVRLKAGTDLERLGIVVDADSDLLKRWNSIKSVLNQAGYTNAPDFPDSAGTVINRPIDRPLWPRVGVWIMPDNRIPGMLEDYLALLVPADDTLIDRARQSLDGIPDDDRRFAEAHHTKALIHTWLAWQKDPGAPLGFAITKHYFKAEGPHVSAFLAWLTRLFA